MHVLSFRVHPVLARQTVLGEHFKLPDRTYTVWLKGVKRKVAMAKEMYIAAERVAHF